MAVATKVIRVANPRRGRGKFRLRTNARRTAVRRKAKRKLSPKQIRIFGTPQQKAALKRKYRAKRKNPSSSHRRKRSISRPKVKATYRKRTAKKVRRRRTNPGLVVTLGSVNPRRRTTKVATRKRRTRRRRATNAAPRHHRRRRNARRITVVNPRRRRRNRRSVCAAPVRRRRRNPGRRRLRVRTHRRNPMLFGRSSPKDLMKMIGGGLVGVTVTKMIPKYIPASLVSSLGSSTFVAVAISGFSAWVAGFLAGKIDPEFGQAVMFGGFMQTGSVALNAFLPSIGGQFSLGDLINGSFPVPQNPIRAAGQMVAYSAPAARGMAAYGAAY